jgi:hypothetical protein
MKSATPMDALSSWKEISAYLKCSVRSAQRLQQQSGLPIVRMGTGPRGRVIAYPKQLDGWLAERPRAGKAMLPSQAPAQDPVLLKHVMLLERLQETAKSLRVCTERCRTMRIGRPGPWHWDEGRDQQALQ